MKKTTMGTSTAYNTPAKIAARSKMKKNVEGGKGMKKNTEGGKVTYISSSKPSAGKSNPKARMKAPKGS